MEGAPGRLSWLGVQLLLLAQVMISRFVRSKHFKRRKMESKPKFIVTRLLSKSFLDSGRDLEVG